MANMLAMDKRLAVELNGERFVAGERPEYLPEKLVRKSLTCDQELVLAQLLGWEAVPDDKRGGKWCKFKRGDIWVWQCIGFVGDGMKDIMWQTAYLREGRFQDHQKYPSLCDAFKRAIGDSFEGSVQVGNGQ